MKREGYILVVVLLGSIANVQAVSSEIIYPNDSSDTIYTSDTMSDTILLSNQHDITIKDIAISNVWGPFKTLIKIVNCTNIIIDNIVLSNFSSYPNHEIMGLSITGSENILISTLVFANSTNVGSTSLIEIKNSKNIAFEDSIISNIHAETLDVIYSEGNSDLSFSNNSISNVSSGGGVDDDSILLFSNSDDRFSFQFNSISNSNLARGMILSETISAIIADNNLQPTLSILNSHTTEIVRNEFGSLIASDSYNISLTSNNFTGIVSVENIQTLAMVNNTILTNGSYIYDDFFSIHFVKSASILYNKLQNSSHSYEYTLSITRVLDVYRFVEEDETVNIDLFIITSNQSVNMTFVENGNENIINSSAIISREVSLRTPREIAYSMYYTNEWNVTFSDKVLVTISVISKTMAVQIPEKDIILEWEYILIPGFLFGILIFIFVINKSERLTKFLRRMSEDL